METDYPSNSGFPPSGLNNISLNPNPPCFATQMMDPDDLTAPSDFITDSNTLSTSTIGGTQTSFALRPHFSGPGTATASLVGDGTQSYFATFDSPGDTNNNNTSSGNNNNDYYNYSTLNWMPHDLGTTNLAPFV